MAAARCLRGVGGARAAWRCARSAASLPEAAEGAVGAGGGRRARAGRRGGGVVARSRIEGDNVVEEGDKAEAPQARPVLMDPPAVFETQEREPRMVETEQWRGKWKGAAGRTRRPPKLTLDDDATPCEACQGTGVAMCRRCNGWGRLPGASGAAMLAPGEAPLWCGACRCRGWSACDTCLGSGRKRAPMGFRVP